MLSKLKQSGLVAVMTLVLGAALGLGVAGPLQTVHSQNALDSETQLFHDVYAKANPSVVSINVRIPGGAGGQNTDPNSPFPVPGQGQGQAQPFQLAAGSGFVFDTAGNIVTNAHVVQGADQIEVTFSDDTTMMAKVVGIDLDSDIAVIKVQGDAGKYQPLQLANSDTLTVGDRAIAIGNPFERSGTMTQGIVSGLHRSVDGLASAGQGASYTIPDAIQTDAALNPGNSGGPLLNEQGQVIGVNEQIASQVRQSSGVSFAIPSNIVKMMADGLIKNGKVEHTFLGISGNSLSLDTNTALKLDPNTKGVYVSAVTPGGPAAKAGIKGATSNAAVGTVAPGGDVIVAVDHQPIKHFDDLTSYLFTKTTVGQTITLTVLRNGQQQDIQVTLAARPHAANQ